jgi:hypothetical protein
MDTLDLYKDRTPYNVVLEVKGGKKTFKIPTELTVEETERLLEAELKISAIVKQEVEDKKDEKEKVDQYFSFLLEYILLLLQHYQKNLTMTDLRKMISRAEAIRIFEFFKKQRFLHLLGLDGSADNGGSKKKTESVEKQLELLRQSITFLVINGFGLLEIRKLYFDEFLQYYNSLIYFKEKMGEVKEGTYQTLTENNSGDISSLKNQLFNIQKNGK